VGKFLCVKSVIFMTFWQQALTLTLILTSALTLTLTHLSPNP
jgi:hypothetical protein